MTIEPGRMLLHYRLVEQIGEGGMGSVWKARDTSLDRDVAIKILPEAFAADPARLARFEREAKLLASLSHPNIAAIHGLHHDGAIHFLAMELVEGDDLAKRLKSGPLPVDQALAVGAQMAEALEAAHAQGVIHRDLKPANVVVTPEGRAKVLDFGLAKAMASESGESHDLEHSPTVTSLGTVAGVILGTAAYMSPEQARGKALDKRTDIWSFGCVLYECLTGQMLFAGETATDVLSAVLQREPDWQALPLNTPPRVRDLLERCLERSLRNRVHDVADARIVLEKSLAIREWTASGIQAAADLLPARRRFPGWALAAVGLTVGLIAAFFVAGLLSESSTDLPLRKFRLLTGSGGPFLTQISPDGTRVAYVQGDKLWVRDLDRIEARQVTGGDGVSLFAWSPDGRSLAISRESKLWRLPVTGGEATLLTSLTESLSINKGAGVSWGDDGRIFYNVGDAGLMAVPEQGGAAVSILEPAEGEVDFHNVHALPGGRGVLFVVHDEAIDTIAALTEEGRKEVLVLPGQDVGIPLYSATGHLLFLRTPDNPGIWAVPFSLDRLETTGEPFPVATTDRGRRFNVSRDGTLVFTRPAPPRETRLVLVDRNGLVVRQVGEPQLNQTAPAFSPDGTRVAVTAGDGRTTDIWVHTMESGTRMRLTFSDEPEFGPAWHPSGERIAFSRTGSLAGNLHLMETAADGSGESSELVRGMQGEYSPDGRFLAYTANDEQLDRDIWYLPLDEQGRPGEPTQLLETDGNFNVDFSPDGRLLVYAASETGRSEIYITRFPGADGRWLVSKDGGSGPVWSEPGDRIFYRQGGDLVEVPVTLGASPGLGQPRKLFGWETLQRGFDVTPDGRQFVMVEETDPGAIGPQITVVQNWAAEFETRAADSK